MKLNLPRLISLPAAAGLLLLLLSPETAPAQNGLNPLVAFNQDAGTPAPPDQWIAPDWKDPDITLTNVDYDGLPASEVARNLQKEFNNNFDIMIAPAWTSPTGDVMDPLTDPQGLVFKLQLKNVKASEVFRAMNLLLESENSPFRWQLTVNGNRPLVLLRVIRSLLPQAAHQADARKISVYYVGDLMGDGGMTLKQISDTLQDVNNQGYGGSISIGFHNETQLVIVKGTPEQVALISSTLQALKENLAYTRYKASRPVMPVPRRVAPSNSNP